MIYLVTAGETLSSILNNFRITLKKLQKANPGLTDVFPGQKIVIPGLPNPNSIPFTIRVFTEKKRLVLYKNGLFVKMYPIAVGKMLTKTPVGEYVIVNRQLNPGGPFGVMWLSLSRAGYGIHGTNNPASIGKAVSHGCVRMYNRDVLQLADLVPNGTRVIIQP
ncbi:L,D-transpeptidase family protein [Bacillota bacterium Lsc_1132]